MIVPETEIIVTSEGAEISRQTVPAGEYVIGREPGCEVQLDVELVSRRHARLTVNFDHALIEDLGSSNGTLVNGEPVTGPTRLWPNQKIQIGAATLELRRVKAIAAPDVTLAPQTAAVQRPLPNELLREKKYDIGKVVAQGGMGAILDVRDAATQRGVAMKVMLDGSNADDLTRFVAEARITAQLEHPSIVPIYELSVDENGHPFYTMKMVRGITLRKVLELLSEGVAETVKKYPLPALLTIFQKVCDALAFAHSKGVIHRDLKPENIMLDDFGVVLVMDWGLAKRKEEDRRMKDEEDGGSDVVDPQARSHTSSSFLLPPSSLTLAGSIMGTPQYMSPEQARGEVETLDARSDIYALGAILYHLLALRPAVTGPDAWAIVERVAKGEIEPLTAPPPGKGGHLPGGHIPDSLVAVVRRAMAFDKEQRYGRVADLQRDLEAFQNGFATSAENAGLTKQFVLLVRRHKGVAATAFGAWLFLTALGAWFLVKVTHERNRAETALCDLRKTAPTLIDEGRKLIDAQKFDDAQVKIRFAVQIDPGHAGYRLLLAQLQQARLELRAAADEFQRVLALGPNESAQANLALCEKLLHDYPNADTLDRAAFQQLYAQMEMEGRSTQAAPIAVKLGRSREAPEALLKARVVVWRQIPGWDGHPEVGDRARWLSDGTLSLNLQSVLIDDLSSLSGLPISMLNISNSRVTDLHPLQGMRLRMITMVHLLKLTDLSPLKGMPLEEFNADGDSALSDLSPLAGMKLRRFSAGSGKWSDLSILKGMPLESVGVGDSVLTHLNDLAGMPISYLGVGTCRGLVDVSAARTMRLKSVVLASCEAVQDFQPFLDCPTLEKMVLPRDTREIEVLRKHPRSLVLGYEVGKEKPAGEFWAEFDALWKARADEAVIWAKFREAYAAAGLPEPDTKIVRRLDDGTYALQLDRLPVKVKTIPNLQGLPVSEINLQHSAVTDLTPLAGLPVRKLILTDIPALDLSPLRACPQLEDLRVGANSQRRDVSALTGMKLRTLHLGGTGIRDIALVAGMPLRTFTCNNTEVTDLRPLLSCPDLENLSIPDRAANIGELHALQKLQRLSKKWDSGFDGPAQSVDEFWKEYDAQK